MRVSNKQNYEDIYLSIGVVYCTQNGEEQYHQGSTLNRPLRKAHSPPKGYLTTGRQSQLNQDGFELTVTTLLRGSCLFVSCLNTL